MGRGRKSGIGFNDCRIQSTPGSLSLVFHKKYTHKESEMKFPALSVPITPAPRLGLLPSLPGKLLLIHRGEHFWEKELQSVSKLPCSLRSLSPLLWTRSSSRSAELRSDPKGFQMMLICAVLPPQTRPASHFVRCWVGREY